jgi:preprotein translocase subunit SecB
MNDENQVEQSISIKQLYLKDCSFEAPDTPEIFFHQGEANIEQSMEVSHRDLDQSQNLHEVVLTTTLSAKIGDKTAWIIEVHQGGVFELVNFPEDIMPSVLQIFCPTQLYPYVRETVAGLLAKSGFPPVTLDYFNFEQMFVDQAQGNA